MTTTSPNATSAWSRPAEGLWLIRTLTGVEHFAAIVSYAATAG